ncbi:MAG TPA: ribose-5-phosphate isomerase RpiA [Nitrosarchaeum sp.]|nr:ribose-5-phosphate isomerase RpiA [Nitrosarchaeum sp.]
MSYDDAIEALSTDALKFVRDGFVIGLGSGRAATTFVKSLSSFIKIKNYKIKAVPTSLQIKLIAENGNIPLVEADHVNHIDVAFDGADQIDSQRFVIKGGGGALLRENILFNLSKKVVVMADKSKFVKNFTRTVPVEVHPLARNSVTDAIMKLGGKAQLRSLDKGYPFFTENGNIILDCDFGVIKNPKELSQKIKLITGVMESGIFIRKPDVIYKAKIGGKFDII